ncbi:hypothetical protein H7F15_01250 [Pontibacter sp. Tf4]|nr:hypothetical protein [Pontibacter sp. Tf4]
MRKQLSLLLLLYVTCSVTLLAQNTQPYFLKLHTGEVIPARKIQLKSPLFKSNYFLVDDSLSYSPAMVNAYQNSEGYFARIEPGNHSDAFAKRILEGPRIDKFYTSRMTYDGYSYSPYGYGYGPPRTSRRRVYYFSKDGGPLYLYNHENLEMALGDNPSSLLLLQRYKREKYINTGVTIIGAGLMALGVMNSQRTYDGDIKLSPVLYAGAGILGGQVVFNLFRKDKLMQAVQVYNYQVKQ